jgi:hypothetical protein
MPFTKHANLKPHHKYQLEVIFLFVAGFFLFFPYYYLVENIYFLNMDVLQWYFFLPWIIFYTLYSLKTRASVPKQERVSPLKRPIAHWVLLGIAIVALQTKNYHITPLYSLDIMYIVFSLFLADSYWDFVDKK